MSNTIKIKVGTETFILDKEKLDDFHDTTLAAAYRFNKSTELDFSFRDPALFSVVLDVYRNGKLIVPCHVGYKELKNELEFWGFELPLPVITGPSRFLALDVPGKSGSTLACPWGVYGRELGQCCWMPLACFLWRSILANPCVLELAALGFRDVNVYVKHHTFDDNIGISLILSHKHFMSRLAELSDCTLTFIEGIYGNGVVEEARAQDVICNNNLDIRRWVYVDSYDIAATCRRTDYDVVMTATQSQTIHLVWRGFNITFEVNGSSVFWDCKTEISSEDPIHLSDLTGFLLRISFVLDKTVFEGFVVPSPTSRYHDFKVHIYKSKTYYVHDDQWFRKLGDLTSIICTPDFTDAYIKGVSSVTLLVEETTTGVLELSRISHNTGIQSRLFYERFNISF